MLAIKWGYFEIENCWCDKTWSQVSCLIDETTFLQNFEGSRREEGLYWQLIEPIFHEIYEGERLLLIFWSLPGLFTLIYNEIASLKYHKVHRWGTSSWTLQMEVANAIKWQWISRNNRPNIAINQIKDDRLRYDIPWDLKIALAIVLAFTKKFIFFFMIFIYQFSLYHLISKNIYQAMFISMIKSSKTFI